MMNSLACLLIVAVGGTAEAQVTELWRTVVDHSPYWDFVTDAEFARDGSTTYFGLEQYLPGTLGASGGSVVRVDPQGNVVWSQRYDDTPTGTHNMRFYVGALAPDGGCVAAGQSILLPFPSSDRDVHVVRYDQSGAQMWATIRQDALPHAIAFARDGRVWVAATMMSGPSDVVVWQIAPNGVVLSTTVWDGPAHSFDRPIGIAADVDNGAYVVGTTNEGPTTGQRFVLRITPAGTVHWFQVDGTPEGIATGLVVDPGVGVYVASTVTRPGGYIAALAKYDRDGVQLWDRELHPTPQSIRQFPFVARASNGDVVVASGRGTLRTVRFGPTGNLVSTSAFVSGLSSIDEVAGLALDEDDDALVAFTRQATPSSAYVMKIATTGSQLWLRAVSHAPTDYLSPIGVGAGPAGSAFVAGAFGDASGDGVFVARIDDWYVTTCSGDGSGTDCPCGNAGLAGHGCANSVAPSGARLDASGAPVIGADTLVLAGSGMPDAAVLYFQGTTTSAGGAGTVFGDGLLCVAGTIARIGTKTNVAGASSYPEVGDPSISVVGAVAGGAQSRTYQAWYRNDASFCTPDAFNLTNAITVAWGL